jgi:hypothetical protein
VTPVTIRAERLNAAAQPIGRSSELRWKVWRSPDRGCRRTIPSLFRGSSRRHGSPRASTGPPRTTGWSCRASDPAKRTILLGWRQGKLSNTELLERIPTHDHPHRLADPVPERGRLLGGPEPEFDGHENWLAHMADGTEKSGTGSLTPLSEAGPRSWGSSSSRPARTSAAAAVTMISPGRALSASRKTTT